MHIIAIVISCKNYLRLLWSYWSVRLHHCILSKLYLLSVHKLLTHTTSINCRIECTKGTEKSGTAVIAGNCRWFPGTLYRWLLFAFWNLLSHISRDLFCMTTPFNLVEICRCICEHRRHYISHLLPLFALDVFILSQRSRNFCLLLSVFRLLFIIFG